MYPIKVHFTFGMCSLGQPLSDDTKMGDLDLDWDPWGLGPGDMAFSEETSFVKFSIIVYVWYKIIYVTALDR